ncbi:MAG: hypothetical protein PWQ87_345 [Candidatus Woesearchaeota archaeon]|nr:hypothetical protein [Candidatus Woesearchaeota archaeon]
MPSQEVVSAYNAVKKLKSMGYSNYQIIDAMQAEGFSANDIYEAINLVENEGSSDVTTESVPAASSDEERIQEIAEEIIAERWEEIIANIKKVIDWKNRSEERLNKMEADIEALKEQMSNLNESVLRKIKEYDNHLVEFSSNFRAMENVFKDVLPEFTQSVQLLSSYVEELKPEKGRKKPKKEKEDDNFVEF